MSALFCSCPGSSCVTPRFQSWKFVVLPIAAAVVLFATPASQAQLTTFPATAVGTSTPATQAVTVSVQSAGTVASVKVLTMGAPNLDFTESGTDNCAGISSGSCSVTVAFAPKFPGPRNGAIVLLDAGNNTLGTAHLTGLGQGSLAVMVPGAISIVAGQVGEWTMVNDGGPATQADLYLPSGVAVDGAGNLFIADSHHNRVREVFAAGANAGTIATVAGDGSAGYDAAATVAISTSLNQPGGVAIDGAGNLYIADTNNNVIRKVNLTTGAISTAAGNGAPGYTGDGGLATSATLNSPEGVTVDAAGDLYIADTNNNAVREVVAATGNISTIAGDGTGVPGFSGDGSLAIHAKLNAPYGVALDASGNLYIPDSGNNRVRVVNTSGNISTYAGNGTPAYLGDGSAATSAELYSPLGVACDPAGNVYIADARNYVVRKVNAASGVISTVAGTNADDTYIDGKSDFSYGNGQSGDAFSGGGIATGAGIYAPYGVAVDASGNLLIAEYFDHLIRKVSADDATLFFTPELWTNQVSSPENQTIENDGNATLTFSAVAPDANAAVASSGTTCTTSSTIAVDESCVVAAEFAPTSTANPLPNPLVGNVNLTGNPADAPLDISIVGEALGLNGAIVTLSSSLNPAPYGQTVTLNVSVKQDPNSTQGTPTGTVSFTDTFQGTTSPLGTTQTLNSSGNASLQLTTLAVGTHVITASYSGDTYYSASSSNPLSQVVQEQVTVTVANTGGGNPSAYGATVTFTATVSVSGGIPVSGTVSFYNGATFLGSSTLSGNTAVYSTSTLPVGSNPITASYTDSNNVSSTSSPLTQVVEQNTVTALTSSVNPAIHGTPVSFTAIVTAAGTVVPTGTVTFYDGTVQIGTATLAAAGTTSAAAMFQTSTLAAGTHSITAAYGGDTHDFASTSAALSETVNIASSTTALAASANPDIAGKPLTLTATVTTNGGTAAGTVNFYNGTTLLGAGTLNGAGAATFTSSTLPVGSYSITAAYQGDANDTASTSAALPISIIQATTGTKLVSSSPSVQVTASVTLTATVSGNGATPTGNVTFMDGSNTLGSVAVSNAGVAAYTTSSLTVGSHNITAVYGGDANDAGSTSAVVTVSVTAYATQTSLVASSTSMNTDQELTLLTTTTSTSGGAVTGTITYISGTTTLGSATVGANGGGTLTINPPAGSYSITAHYSGDALNAPSVSNGVTVTVSAATEFSIGLNPTSLSIPTKQSANVTINLGSQDGFTDKIALGCSSLPYSVTCNFASNDVTLGANGTTSVQLTVDTNSPLASGSQARKESPFSSSGILAACAFPGAALFGLAFWRFRKNAAVLRALAVIAMLAGTTLLMTGCGGFSTNSAKPGNYVIQVTATGEQTGVVHVANLTVTVTQ